jgi:MFS family permease
MKPPARDTFIFLLCSRAFRSIALIYMTLAFSLYLSALGVGVVEIGIIAGASVLFMALMTLFLGMIGDRHGYKSELIISEAVTLAGAMIVASSANITFIEIGMILAGLSSGAGGLRGAFSPGVNAFVAGSYPDHSDRVKKFSLLTSIASISAIFGSVMLGSVSMLTKYIGLASAYRAVFLLSSFMLIISLASLLMLKEHKRPQKTTRMMKPSSFAYVSKIIVSNSIGGVGMGIAVPLLPLWFVMMYHANTLQISIIFSISYIITALGAYVSSRIYARINALNTASATRAFNGLLLIAMAFSPLLALSGLLYVLRSFSVGMGSPSRSAVNVRGVHEEDYGTATSLQGVSTRISQLSSGASGYLMDYSVPLPLFVGGIFQFASGIAYKLLLGQEKDR